MVKKATVKEYEEALKAKDKGARETFVFDVTKVYT
jgi:hypothetical protein